MGQAEAHEERHKPQPTIGSLSIIRLRGPAKSDECQHNERGEQSRQAANIGRGCLRPKRRGCPQHDDGQHAGQVTG